MSTAAPHRTDGHRSTPDGFTLVELLVVMVVIGVLAAIAIPSFLNQRAEGWRAAVKSDLANAAVAAEALSARDGGAYTGITTASLAAERGSGVSPDVAVTVLVSSQSGYCLVAVHADLADETWYYDSARGSPTRQACDPAGP